MKAAFFSLLLLLCWQGSTLAEALPGSDLLALIAEGDRMYDTRDEPGHSDKAIELYQQALGIDPKNEAALWKLSRSFKWRGDIASSSEEKMTYYKQGETWAKRAIEVNPQSVGGHLMLGIAYGRIGETQGVMKSLSLISPIKNEMNAVLEREPSNDVAHHVLGVLYRKVPGLMGGSIKKSIEALQEAIRLNPAGTGPYLDLARSYLEKGKKDEAKASLEKLLAVDHPSDRVQSKQDRREAEKLLAELQSP
ncbi:MAG: tetratricopeptide repeat protein [Candidatus Manganitrophus sp.]|nr:tetratricopeptide repeat protein [Candidatus Manganitrophus sp.]